MCASNSTLFDPNKKIPFKKAPLLMLALRWTPNFFGSIACWGRYLAGCEIWSNIFLPDKFISGLLYPSHSSEIRNFWFDFHIVKNGKFWSVFFDNFIKHKPLISDEGCPYVNMLCEIYHYRQYFLTKKSANGRSQNEKEIEICAKYLFFCKKKCTNNQ